MTIELLDAQGLSETHAAMRETARRVAEAEISPIAAELDESETYPADLYRNLARAGLFGITVPEALGGELAIMVPPSSAGCTRRCGSATRSW